jgi:hypothetical protein
MQGPDVRLAVYHLMSKGKIVLPLNQLIRNTLLEMPIILFGALLTQNAALSSNHLSITKEGEG